MTRILIIGLIILIFILALFVVFGSKKQEKVQPPPILTAPSSSPQPGQNVFQTFNPRAKMPIPTSADLKPLQVVSVEPKEDLSRDHNPVTEVKFIFSDDIDLNNFLLTISPNTQITIIPDTATHSYTISPNTFWPDGITTFTIQQGTKSLKGATLESVFTYNINIQSPKNPPPDAEL